jgi:hypothetical protein
LWSESLRRLIDFRDDGRESRFFDVGFAELQQDAIGAVERLYSAMGDELTDEARRRMVQWWHDNESDRRRGPRPDPSAYGLDVDGLRNEFAFYHDRFGIVAL